MTSVSDLEAARTAAGTARAEADTALKRAGGCIDAAGIDGERARQARDRAKAARKAVAKTEAKIEAELEAEDEIEAEL